MHAKTNCGDVGSGEVGGIAETHKTTSDSSRRQLLYETRPSDDHRLRGCDPSRMQRFIPPSASHLRASEDDIEQSERLHVDSFTSKEMFLRLPGPHDRIINHLRLYESFSTCPRSNSKPPGLGNLATGSFLEKI
jgi:hypothetical protein